MKAAEITCWRDEVHAQYLVSKIMTTPHPVHKSLIKVSILASEPYSLHPRSILVPATTSILVLFEAICDFC